MYFDRALAVLSELDAADEAVAQAQSTPSGPLRINAPMSYGTFRLGPAIAEFMEKYPDVKIQLILSHELLDPVQDGFDVTLRIAELESSSLIAREDHTDRPGRQRLARLSCASRHSCPPPRSPRPRIADLRIPTDGQSVETDGRGRRPLDPAILVIVREQCRGAARRCHPRTWPGADPDLHRGRRA